MSRPFLHPLDIISFLIESDGRTSNTLLVKQFSSFLQGNDDVAVTNKNILKSVTGHVATLRRQGTRDVGELDNTRVTGKVIVMRNKYGGKSAEDVWSSLILSLPMDEITRLTPTHDDNDNITEEGDDEETITHPASVQHSNMEDDDELEEEDEPQARTIPDIVVEDVHGETEDTREISVSPEFIETSTYDLYDRRTDLEEDIKAIPTIEDIDMKEFNEAEMRQDEIKKFDKTSSVKDLANNFNQIASSSSLSLSDHLQVRTQEEKSEIKSRRRPQSVVVDKCVPLTPEGKAWLRAAMRGDYQTLARLARGQEDLVHVRDPATGYKAIHWAAKHGNEDVIKLLAGTYGQDPNVKTRGGYTPLMLAAQTNRHSTYDLLVNTYAADEMIRDYSGRTSAQYLDQKHWNIPGVPPRMELSHDIEGLDEDDVDTGVRKSRRQVARSATHHFLKEFRDSMRDVRGSFREQWMRPKSVPDNPY